MVKLSKKPTGPSEDKLITNILITFLIIPCIVVVGFLLFIIFGTAEFFSIFTRETTGDILWPVTTPYLILIILVVPLLLLSLFLFRKHK